VDGQESPCARCGCGGLACLRSHPRAEVGGPHGPIHLVVDTEAALTCRLVHPVDLIGMLPLKVPNGCVAVRACDRQADSAPPLCRVLVNQARGLPGHELRGGESGHGISPSSPLKSSPLGLLLSWPSPPNAIQRNGFLPPPFSAGALLPLMCDVCTPIPGGLHPEARGFLHSQPRVRPSARGQRRFA
jgi:hypothetical protein